MQDIYMMQYVHQFIYKMSLFTLDRKFDLVCCQFHRWLCHDCANHPSSTSPLVIVIRLFPDFITCHTIQVENSFNFEYEIFILFSVHFSKL